MSNLIAKFDMLYLSSSKPVMLAPCSLARCWRKEVCLQMPWLFWVCCDFLQVLLKQTVLVSFSENLDGRILPGSLVVTGGCGEADFDPCSRN